MKNKTWHPIKKKILIFPELHHIIHRVVNYQNNWFYTLALVLQEIIYGQINASYFIGEGYNTIESSSELEMWPLYVDFYTETAKLLIVYTFNSSVHLV